MADGARIDHLPFYAHRLDDLATAFEALGFTVSPPGQYVSPQQPDARWPNRAVFLDTGWFDLLLAEQLQPGEVKAPGACLLSARDLDKCSGDIPVEKRGPRYRLEHCWDGGPANSAATFEILPIRERAFPIPLGLISRERGATQLHDSWREHPNTAIELSTLILPERDRATLGEPLASAKACGAIVEMPPDDYQRRYGEANAVVVVRVGRLETAATALRGPFIPVEAGLLVTTSSDLPCAFEFRA